MFCRFFEDFLQICKESAKHTVFCSFFCRLGFRGPHPGPTTICKTSKRTCVLQIFCRLGNSGPLIQARPLQTAKKKCNRKLHPQNICNQKVHPQNICNDKFYPQKICKTSAKNLQTNLQSKVPSAKNLQKFCKNKYLVGHISCPRSRLS